MKHISKKAFTTTIALTIILLGICITTFHGETNQSSNGLVSKAQASGQIKNVWVIVMENNNWSSVKGSAAPYITNTLLPLGAHAEQYYNPSGSHPSEPNYVWMEAGASNSLPGTHDFTSDGDPSASNTTTTTNHLTTLLNTAGISWKAYEEDASGTGCPTSSSGNYAAKHNPFVFFQDVTSNATYCNQHIRPYTELAADLAGTTPAYNFITPNLCNDMHDCSIQTGDTWLSTAVPAIMNSTAYKNGGAIFITWDEAASGDGPIGMIVLSPFAKKNYSNTIKYDHSSLVKTLAEIFGVSTSIGAASSATDLSDMFTVPLASTAQPSTAPTTAPKPSTLVPTNYCLGVPCPGSTSTAPSVSTVPSGSETNPSTSQTPGGSGTLISTAPGVSISPCGTGTNSTFSTNSKAHRKWRRGSGGSGGGGGFLSQFFQLLLQLLEKLFQMLGISFPGLPTPTTPSPTPCPGASTTPSTAPSSSPSSAPGTSTAPSTSTAPGTSIIPSALAPTAAAGATGTTCGGSANTPSSPVTGYTISGCEDFTSGFGAFSPYTSGGGSTTVGTGRTAGQCAVTGGALVLTQGSDGATCGGSTSFSQKYGYWEVRMRAYTTGSGSGSAPHPVLILWPDTDNWPADGELDYFETDIGNPAGGFLHCASSAGGNCYTLPSNSVDYSQWHVYGFEWTASGFTGWIDGKQWYTTSDSGPQSTSAMHQTIQLDNLSGNATVDPAKMEVDWMHMYKK